MIDITVNGDAMSLAEDSTITDLIQKMELMGKRIAIELNMDVIPRSEHAQTRLSTGDAVEVVRAIGGG
mgnify:CR=1 FL=1